MQQATKRGILLCRMVRDNLNKVVVQSQKQNRAAETQSQSQLPVEPAGPERGQSPERVHAESKEAAESRLDLLLWSKFNFEDEPETWGQVSAKFTHRDCGVYCCEISIFIQ